MKTKYKFPMWINVENIPDRGDSVFWQVHL